ncbi:hypothetical protein LEP1GSC125_2877 [Leptospira mayottensis 200901122]|uniref:Uncharacterized protein n=1 Tax=Leptospira mayottensis 200901122 TaxID=1193010 RepID=A0AA87MMV6_9LEPT|nr:hypothetical protein LEP1GSC125_2877 [Leptospira mayottensis 200901122]
MNYKLEDSSDENFIKSLFQNLDGNTIVNFSQNEGVLITDCVFG